MRPRAPCIAAKGCRRSLRLFLLIARSPNGAAVRDHMGRFDEPARVAQASAQRVGKADAEWAARGLRFARFAAAMQDNPTPQDGVLDVLCRSVRRKHPTAASSIRPARGAADPVKSVTGIQWLGIGSWAFFCVALFVSLHPGRDAIDRGTGPQTHHALQRTIVSGVPPTADPIPLPSSGRGVAIGPPPPAPEPGG